MTINQGTQLYKIFQILSDLEWHCAKHELPGTQPAKPIQILRQHGYLIENKTKLCISCNSRTVHRRLISLDIETPSIVRQQIPSWVRQRVLEIYKNTEAITLREETPNLLEVDHRFPQVRWNKPEAEYPVTMSDDDIKIKFQLLTRAHNLWKSRYCENCFKTGKRGTFIGINFFAKGNENWDPSISPHSEDGCLGCFWYDPTTWRAKLNLLIVKKT